MQWPSTVEKKPQVGASSSCPTLPQGPLQPAPLGSHTRLILRIWLQSLLNQRCSKKQEGGTIECPVTRFCWNIWAGSALSLLHWEGLDLPPAVQDRVNGYGHRAKKIPEVQVEKYYNAQFLTPTEPPLHTNCLEHPGTRFCFPFHVSVDLGPRNGSVAVRRKRKMGGGRRAHHLTPMQISWQHPPLPELGYRAGLFLLAEHLPSPQWWQVWRSPHQEEVIFLERLMTFNLIIWTQRSHHHQYLYWKEYHGSKSNNSWVIKI